MPKSKVYGLFVGLNYEGTENALQGCVNDANDYSATFMEGVSAFADYDMLLENEGTKGKILTTLESIVEQLKYRDTLIFTFSGHGTWLPDTSGDEPDGKDEALVPWDYDQHVILDDELNEIFAKRKRGSKIVMITDCCHSGTVFRLMGQNPLNSKVRFLPPSRLEFLSAAKEKTAEKKEKTFLASSLIKKENKPQSGLIHLAGCQDTEYSYDAFINGRPCGAFTYHLLNAYRNAVPGLTYEKLIAAVREELPSYEYLQRPKLNATSTDARSVVIGK